MSEPSPTKRRTTDARSTWNVGRWSRPSPNGTTPHPVRSRDLVLLVNKASGRGKGERMCAALAGALTDQGHRVARTFEAHESASPEFSEALGESEGLVVVGGDGTVHHVLDQVVDARAALFHVPMGTENLFARGFGMKRRVSAVLASVDAWRVETVDVGVCNGRAFGVMVSCGPDAAIVHGLTRHRRGRISHLSYVPWIVRAALRPHLPRLRVVVDGVEVVVGRTGLVVIGNSREYAVRLNPAHRASMTDGLLDMAFLPARSSLRVVSWAQGLWTGMAPRAKSLVYAQGREVLVEAEGEAGLVQIDGEAPGVEAGDASGLTPREGRTPLRITIRERALRVLVPVS